MRTTTDLLRLVPMSVFVLVPFMICLIMVRFKSSQDILQGVSKLDYYLKVSVF